MSYLKSALSNLSKRKVLCTTKKLEIWDQKYLGSTLKKAIVIFAKSTLEFVKAKKSYVKPINLSLGRKYLLFVYI